MQCRMCEGIVTCCLLTRDCTVGTGTPTGDPIEMSGIGKVFTSHRSRGEPLFVLVPLQIIRTAQVRLSEV